MGFKLTICIFNWYNLSNCFYFLRFKKCTNKITLSAACLPKKVCTDIKRKNIKQRRKCFIISFHYYFSNYDAFVLVGHLKYIKIIAMKWRDQLQIIVFILAHINWLYVGCHWILCQHDNWVIILSAECTANLHTYFIRHERSFCSAHEGLQRCQRC